MALRSWFTWCKLSVFPPTPSLWFRTRRLQVRRGNRPKRSSWPNGAAPTLLVKETRPEQHLPTSSPRPPHKVSSAEPKKWDWLCAEQDCNLGVEISPSSYSSPSPQRAIAGPCLLVVVNQKPLASSITPNPFCFGGSASSWAFKSGDGLNNV